MSNPNDSSDDDDDNDVPLMVRQKLVKLAQQRDDSLPPLSDEDCQTIASEHNVSVKVVREIFASTPRISASAAPTAEVEEEAAPKRGKRQSAIEASAFIQNNMNGEKDDDDDDDDDEDDGDDNECTKSGTKAASNRTTAHNSIDEDFKPAASVAKMEESGDLFSESLASTLNSKGGIKSIEALLKFTELMKSCSDARVVKNADKKRVVLLSPLLRTDVGIKEKKILNAVVGGKTDGEVLDILAAWLSDSANRHSSDVLVSILRCLKMLPVTTPALERTGLGKSVKKLKKYVFVPQANDENPAESKEAAEKVPKLSDQLFERWKQKALEELERSENEKRTEAANKKRKLEQEKKEAEKAAEKEKKKAKVQLKDADDIDDVIKKQKKDVSKKETTTTKTTVTRTVVSRPAIIAAPGTVTPATTETLKKRKTRETVKSAAADSTKPKKTKIGGVSTSMLYNSASKESSKKIGVPSALLTSQTKKEKKEKVKKAYFETHLPYSDDPNEIKFKHKSEREAADGKGKPKQKKSLTWASSDELEQRKIYVPDPNDWLIKYEDKSAGMDVDDDSDASVEAALKRKAREEESERNAAAKARKRKMEQMRATTSWKVPKDIPRDPELNIACGEDSRELHRIAGIVARKKAVVYKDRKEVPDSPVEAPEEESNEDEILEIPIRLAVEPAQQQQHQPVPSPPQQQQMQYHHPPPPPVQQQAPPLYAPPPQVGIQYPPPPPPPQQQQPVAAAAPQLNQAAIQALLNQFNRPAGAPPGVPPASTGVPMAPSAARAPAVSHTRPITAAAKNHPRGVCAFFNSPTGCSWGDKCGFLHQVGLTAEKPKKHAAAAAAAAAAKAASANPS
jgi:hypothetical protein